MTTPDAQHALPVRMERHGARVAVVTIDRPEARNAINGAVTRAMHNIVDATEADSDIWVVVITGASGVFCAGADLKEVAESGFESLYTQRGFAGFTRAEHSKPWIAAVEGFALAGGCEIALACDLIVASESASFGLPETSRGLIAAAGGLYRLTRSIPRAIAAELILTAGRLSAARAAELGIVNRIAPKGSALAHALQLAELVASNAPLAIRESLAILRRTFDEDEASLQERSEQAQARLSRTHDFSEGPRAFIEKRSPRWRGS